MLDGILLAKHTEAETSTIKVLLVENAVTDQEWVMVTEVHALSFHHVAGVCKKGDAKINKPEAEALVMEIVTRLKLNARRLRRRQKSEREAATVEAGEAIAKVRIEHCGEAGIKIAADMAVPAGVVVDVDCDADHVTPAASEPDVAQQVGVKG